MSAGNGVTISSKTTNSSSEAYLPTVSLTYDDLGQNDLSQWVLFHAFITGDKWTIPSYMGTIYGVVKLMKVPRGMEQDYDNFLGTVYGTTDKMPRISYMELYDRFIKLDEHQSGMVRNLLLELRPGPQWVHSEMADYSYWRMIIDFSIFESIIGLQPPCTETHKCSTCLKSAIPHKPQSSREWIRTRLRTIVGNEKIADEYLRIAWTVRENIRHKTVHESDYPHLRSFSELQNGDNEFDIDTVINNFKSDTYALNALVDYMHGVTRILLLNNVLHIGVFPDIRPYMIHSGGMSWDDFVKLTEKI